MVWYCSCPSVQYLTLKVGVGKVTVVAGGVEGVFSCSKTSNRRQFDHRLVTTTFCSLCSTEVTGGGTFGCCCTTSVLIMGSVGMNRRLKPGLDFA